MDGTLPTLCAGNRRALAATLLVAAGLAGCSGFTGTTAASFLRKVREDPDPNTRYLAYHKLASPHCYDSEEQKKEAVATLVNKLEQGKEPVATRAVICRTLGELHDPAAREALIKAVGDNEGLVRSQACRSLGQVGLPDDATILSRVMTVDTLEDCRIAAIEGLGEMRAKDPRILEVLVNSMEHPDPATRLASLNALRKITKKDLGVEAGPWRKELLAKSTEATSAPTTR
ncbi:HEAT repeat-containing protein [Singulisphaera sp. GP187]|uniref:HEAT repeat domain-containing protein n=1 Tax=Singulisphaera sp. GP187 TaxID=1882752 RepID=UPI00092B9B75|nr:HEAT repeat domain-containing protein [Singulisphaera sp. GP187]SIO60068.1 HEAT repeat-containing protein [Singulisphaera sp. GP187]